MVWLLKCVDGCTGCRRIQDTVQIQRKQHLHAAHKHVKYEDKSLRLTSWQSSLWWQPANKLTTCGCSVEAIYWASISMQHSKQTGKKLGGVKATIKSIWSVSLCQSLLAMLAFASFKGIFWGTNLDFVVRLFLMQHSEERLSSLLPALCLFWEKEKGSRFVRSFFFLQECTHPCIFFFV